MPTQQGKHLARHTGKGRTPDRLLSPALRRERPLTRGDNAAPVGGETAAALKQALERGDRR
jgi:hypothetical protein